MTGAANSFAHLVLVLWVPVTVVLFLRLSRIKAILWSVVGGYLALPEKTLFDAPIIPALDKALIPSLTAVIMCMILDRNPKTRVETRPGWLPEGRMARFLTLGFLAVPVFTVFMNSDPIFVGRVLPGLRPYDAGAFTLEHAVLILPFLLARRYLIGPEAQQALMTVFLIGVACYALPILWEARMSPQLHRQLFGIFQSNFGQHIRDGFRPIVFLHHGLWLGIFLGISMIAAATFWRLGRPLAWAMVIGIWMLLVVSRNLGATLLGVLFTLVVRFLGLKWQMRICAVLCLMVLVYPMLRSTAILPVDGLANQIIAVNPERGASFAFRLRNEQLLLDRANERPVAGWGGYGRPLIWDRTTGDRISIADGRWIITLGIYGWVGYLAEFGLFVLPVLAFAFGAARHHVTVLTAGLSCMLTASMVDMIPNDTLEPITWLIVGTLLAAVERPQAVGTPDPVPKRRRWEFAAMPGQPAERSRG